METKLIPANPVPTSKEDPEFARALFFAEMEYRELVAVIPKAVPHGVKIH